MPEYLAPGVYVEETSFRSKSIEGVSTSITGFVGPTQKGPEHGTPELITNPGDFERLYGGLEGFQFGPNYLAHAVRAYFEQGGRRLYISRVYETGAGTGHAVSANLTGGAEAGVNAERVRFFARTPGAAGNGRLTLLLKATAATKKTLEAAPDGTLVRVGGSANPARPAHLQGGLPPFSLPHNGVLRLNTGGANIDLTFRGTAAEAIGTVELADDVDLDDANTTLRVTIDGLAQTIPLPTAATPRAEFVAALNRALRNGYARLTDAGEAPANRLVIGSDRRGRQAQVVVSANAELGFAAATTVLGTADAANNVGDLARVTADEINELLAAGNQARAALTTDGHLQISSVATGAAATLSVTDAGANSVHVLTGFALPATATGADGTTVNYHLKDNNSYAPVLDLSGIGPNDAPTGGADFLTLTVVAEERVGDMQAAQPSFGNAIVYEDLGFAPRHARYLGNVLRETPTRRAEQLQNLFAVEIGARVTPLELRDRLFGTNSERVVMLSGGNDGSEPTNAAYQTALAEFEKLEDISIVAAPGSSAYAQAQSITESLITHAEQRRAYRIAVLDTPAGMVVSDARTVRSRLDSKHAALYYPWVIVDNPLARPGNASEPREIALPPSGFICGIYARNDNERGVFKAPANEPVRGALRFESDINFAQQEVLNPLGINCLRFLTIGGNRVWGARTVSSDPEWKYVNVRRYFNYLEASIDRGMQWAVFEPNGERLWANIRNTVYDFLLLQWKSGALLGTTAKEAFFVRCDRSTMTQNDLDNGRLICLIGVAAIKPAEFVIFRIGQKTADARS